MSSLTLQDKRLLEGFLRMREGYVLDFTNPSFGHFVFDAVDADIHDDKYTSNLSTVGHGLAELRGLYGTGHGQHGTTTGLTPRHAKLAVGAASTLATFLFETHEQTK